MKNLKKLTILHSNDMHGDFLAEQIDENLVGGVSFLSGYVNQVRKQEKNVIYAIAGDMFRGSVIDSEYKGVSTIGIMNLLGPDVATIGNHEVDYGLSHLLFLEKCANFPIINANFHIRANWKRLFQPFYIAEMDGMKILFIGIITEDVLAQTKAEELIGSFVDIGEAAQEVGNICNAYNAIDIDFTVLLTHIGFEKDKKLAALLDPAWGVDVIIGGHSHTLLTEPALVNGIYIVQAGTGTDQIGRFDIMVDTDLNAIDTFTWQLIPINNTTCQKDEEMEEFINHYRRETDKKYDRIVTRFTKCLTHPVRNQETALGNLIADILRDSLGIDLALMGSGAIRNYELGPVVHYQDLVECLPYDEAMYMVQVNGAQLERMLRYILREEAFEGEHTEFYQFSHGLRIVWSRSRQEFEALTLEGKALNEQKLYSIALSKYHYMNMQDFLTLSLEEAKANALPRVLATSCRDIIEEYMMVNPHLSREVEGRLVVKL
ncbi:bifunctional UDP-sugar hydrolase/5'-nucleotidase [Mediterraneibacter faecis]|uniref:bifunctional metallophosphatase/5'-nucleotidase n=1 Tax=Fusicatenibacter saccharivorans TaxID=1150298 RepID=UPI00306ED0B2|nr:bifunctional metallophosphatase/5'-nucleotidase [Lachnospiraceae bacterium]